MASESDSPPVLSCGELAPGALARLLGRYGLVLREAGADEPIPGSHWGEPEAGLIGREVWVRPDTPVHSALHEACHSVCMDDARRRELDTDAGGDDLEECGVCYLQILLAEYLPGVGAARLCADMDAWGYSFRVGSTAAWFEGDASDARDWLLAHGLIDAAGEPTWRLRGDAGSGTHPALAATSPGRPPEIPVSELSTSATARAPSAAPRLGETLWRTS